MAVTKPSLSFLEEFSSHAFSVRLSRVTVTPGIASLNPGLMSWQPFGLHLHAGGVIGV